MNLIWDGIIQALQILMSTDSEVWQVLALTLKISGTATLASLILGVLGGVGLALGRFPGRQLLITLVNTGMGLPPVLAGLLVSVLLWRSGPLGSLNLIYTPT